MSGISLKNNHENDGIGELNRGTPMIRRRTKFKIRIGVIAILIGLTGAWIKPAVAARIITKEHGRRCKYPLLSISSFKNRSHWNWFAKIKNRFQITKSCAPISMAKPHWMGASFCGNDDGMDGINESLVYLKSTRLKWEHSM